MALIISFANEASQNFENSMKKWGYDYQIIGQGVQWKGFISTRVNHYISFLGKIIGEDQHHLVILVDCFDVLACGPPTELLSKYKQYFKDQVVIGGETFCTTGGKIPRYRLNNFWAGRERPSRNSNVNAGFIMGPPDRIYKILVDISSNPTTDDDQYELAKYIDETKPIDVSIDTDYKIIANDMGYNHHFFIFSDGRISFTPTGENPCFIHLPTSKIDFNVRYNYYGRKILGSLFNSISYYPYKNKIIIWSAVVITISIILYLINRRLGMSFLIIFLLGILYYTGGFTLI